MVAKARISASMILVKPRPDGSYSVLLMKRKKGMSFAQAHVFPGGALDPSDSLHTWGPLLGVSPEVVPAMHNVDTVEVNSLKIAAIRETFEESGIFLGSGPLGPPVTTDFFRLCQDRSVLPDLSRVHLFTRNITPLVSKRRFDTTFFIAFVPPDTTFVVTEESESALWASPLEALNLAEAGEMLLEPPQAYIIVHLAHHPFVTELQAVLPLQCLAYPLPTYGVLPDNSEGVLVLVYGDEDFQVPPGFPEIKGKRHRIRIALPGVDVEISPGLMPFHDASHWVVRKTTPHRYTQQPKPRL